VGLRISTTRLTGKLPWSDSRYPARLFVSAAYVPLPGRLSRDTERGCNGGPTQAGSGKRSDQVPHAIIHAALLRDERSQFFEL
jgi:hypothetical protein